VKSPASSAPSRLSPEILAALPKWADPERAAEWSERELESETSKMCTGCHEVKRLTEFHLMRSMYGGRYPRCKECRRNERLRGLGRVPAEE
jgi:hypothetical protein